MSGVTEWICERLMSRIARRNRKLGQPMAVFAWDYVGVQVMIHGTYEGPFLDAALAFLKERGVDTGGTYLDVGANIGNHALYFARLGRRVIAFEPNRRVYRVLQLNAEGTNIELYNLGLSDHDGTVQFEEVAGNLGESRIVRQDPAGRTLQSIEVRAFDGIEALKGQPIDIMKVDVEFHEFEVFSGCHAMLATQRPAIMFEQMAEEINDGTSRTVELLRSHGYRFFYYGHPVDFPRGIRGAGAFLMDLIGQRQQFRPLNTLRKKAYNIIALPEERAARGRERNGRTA